ncbi:hypothetical protein ACLQ3B_05380 [Micromonospora sp. DT53]
MYPLHLSDALVGVLGVLLAFWGSVIRRAILGCGLPGVWWWR